MFFAPVPNKTPAGGANFSALGETAVSAESAAERRFPKTGEYCLRIGESRMLRTRKRRATRYCMLANEPTQQKRWGKPNRNDWNQRSELAALRERGGSPYACAAAIGVDHKQLDRWIKRKAPWTCWIPIKLLGALDAYLDDLPKVEKPQSTRDVSQKPRDVRAAAVCSVELARAEERPFRRDEEFGEAFLHVVGNQPPSSRERRPRSTARAFCCASRSARSAGSGSRTPKFASTRRMKPDKRRSRATSRPGMKRERPFSASAAAVTWR